MKKVPFALTPQSEIMLGYRPMATGLSRIFGGFVAAVLLFIALVLPLRAQDQVQLQSGDVITGKIVGVAGGQVSITSKAVSGGMAKLSYDLSSIKSVQMDPPAAVTQAQNAPPATVIATLAPLVQQFAGLPADWVVDAMGALAEAYDSAGQDDQATALYTQINQLYPNSHLQNAAVAGTARLQLQHGDADAALATLKPLVDQANSDLAPSPAEGRSYARAFLVYGQALEKKQQYSQALEAFLTVKTMFYQNPQLVAKAEQEAAALRQANPGVGVE
jgi:tetratricopeptide (TPR) repeat protein